MFRVSSSSRMPAPMYWPSAAPNPLIFSLNARLVLPIFARLSFEQRRVDSAVEPVFIHDIQAVLQPSVFPLDVATDSSRKRF